MRGYAVTALENVALWHERDISHSSAERVILPDATATLYYMLDRMHYVLEGLEVYPGRMKANLNLTRGLIFSGRVLVELAAAGATREEAYDAVQNSASDVTAGKASDLKAALARRPLVKKYLPGRKLAACFDLAHYLRHINDIYKRAGFDLTK
jgi:adenylosuccinate lyase